ncbi:DUF998 domain-containing protein [Cellulomonas chengniuliangii]|uniref:DUF998 domain-containing protein n=1 Tax=Cellulomonas chengniuliangii TaxID=2968084 RepID=A0ABY5L0Y6_9CELL|nr:DUF998 domain-containing protein [Cellulomonas chengniuliangii]MCC2307478.1 DUF998 domain-containing protein [Cellulomonas chengniuliangii]UUI75748.1 DUF998 domain-containing protein [Cellulomonas chengniuliangii]
MGRDCEIPGWAVASAATAPVAMIGSWTVAASLQDGYSPVRDTISWLAARAAVSPEIAACGFAATGLAHVVTAAGLRPVPRAGRLVLGIGGLATVGLGLLPVDDAHTAHVAAAGVAFVALATWPAVARDAAGIGRLAPWSGLVAASGMAAMAAWYALEMQRVTPGKGSLTGLAERTFAVTQALWPLVVVVAARTGPAPGAATAVAASAGVRARRWPWRLPRAATR